MRKRVRKLKAVRPRSRLRRKAMGGFLRLQDAEFGTPRVYWQCEEMIVVPGMNDGTPMRCSKFHLGAKGSL